MKESSVNSSDASRTHGTLPIETITLLPVQPIESADLDQVIEELRSRGIRVTTERPILRPAGAYDADRRQLNAEVLLERTCRVRVRPVLALTGADCYASSLNFVFGIAENGAGCAVVSLHRLHQGATEERFRTRAIKEIFHELGHALGLGHCQRTGCVMQFNNSLSAADSKTEHLCSACQVRLRRTLKPRR